MNNLPMGTIKGENNMLIVDRSTKLYDIRKVSGYEAYNSYYNGTMFAPKDMKIIGCGTGQEKCVEMTEEEKKQQLPPLKPF
tara:strand:- start:2045 stop:2287 length:243 start_codon:yes stop_codon:yes gene_type:complete